MLLDALELLFAFVLFAAFLLFVLLFAFFAIIKYLQFSAMQRTIPQKAASAYNVVYRHADILSHFLYRISICLYFSIFCFAFIMHISLQIYGKLHKHYQTYVLVIRRLNLPLHLILPQLLVQNRKPAHHLQPHPDPRNSSFLLHHPKENPGPSLSLNLPTSRHS